MTDLKKKSQKLKSQSREYSIKEGMFSSIKTSLSESYISPFAIALNASNSMVSLLTSVMGLFGPASQMVGSNLINKYSRKKILTKAITYEILSIIPLIIISLLYMKGVIVSLLPLILLISFSFYLILQDIAYPAWFSWMGDLVEEKYRGRYFAKRSLLVGFISVIFSIAASLFLDYMKDKGILMIGFAAIFLLAIVARIISLSMANKQYEPKFNQKKHSSISFSEFLKTSPKTNIGKFTIFRSLLAFTGALISPLVAIYLLRNLEFTYTNYMMVVVGGTFISLFALEIWGKLEDRYGNYGTIMISTIIVILVPILWILNKSVVYLLFIPSLIEGIAWNGILLSQRNIIYDNVNYENRAKIVSYFTMVWGIGVALGGITGAILLKFLHTKFIEPIILIFIISAVLRLIISIWWLPKIKEIKHKKKFKIGALKKIFTTDLKKTIIAETHQLIRIKKYLK